MSKAQAAKEMLAKFTLKAKAVVLNLSDVAIKAQEATNNEKWGPHGQLMSGGWLSDAGSGAAWFAGQAVEHEEESTRLQARCTAAVLQRLPRAAMMPPSSRRCAHSPLHPPQHRVHGMPANKLARTAPPDLPQPACCNAKYGKQRNPALLRCARMRPLQVWEVLRKRMEEGVGPKWRLTYKSLLVIEFLIKQSSQARQASQLWPCWERSWGLLARLCSWQQQAAREAKELQGLL